MNGLYHGSVYEAMALMTPDIARKGVIGNSASIDIITYFCDYCETEDHGLHIANALVGMGYAYNSKSFTNFGSLVAKRYWKLFHFLMTVTKLYASCKMLDNLYHQLNRKQLEPFIEHGAKSKKTKIQLILRSSRKSAQSVHCAHWGGETEKERQRRNARNIASRME